jgi:hypothetical protein
VKKLRLDLETVEVESFELNSTKGRGTVGALECTCAPYDTCQDVYTCSLCSFRVPPCTGARCTWAE